MSKGKPPAKSSDTSANLGFEAKLWLAADTALRDSAFLRAGGKLQVMPERRDNLRNNMDAAEPSGARQPERSGDSPACFNSKRTGQTAKGSPKGERGAANQYKHVVLGLIFLSRAERDRSRASVTRRASAGPRVKYISDTSDEHHAKLVAGEGDSAGANPEDKDEPSGTNRVERDSLLKAARRAHAAACGKQPAAGSPKGERGSTKQYLAANGFWVPADARWPQLQSRAKLPSIGKDVDGEMSNVECGMSNFRLTNSTFETG